MIATQLVFDMTEDIHPYPSQHMEIAQLSEPVCSNPEGVFDMPDNMQLHSSPDVPIAQDDEPFFSQFGGGEGAKSEIMSLNVSL